MRIRHGMAAALAIGVLAPAGAHAATYCVKTTCEAGEIPVTKLVDALDAAAANPGRDTVRLAAERCAPSTPRPLVYDSPDPVDIVGAGNETLISDPDSGPT